MAIPEGFDVTRVVLSDQLKSLDWRTRRAKLIGELPEAVIQEVLAKIQALIG